jgi:ribosomal protein L21
VELSVEDNAVRGDKVTAVRYKAKKRVMKVRGHKQAKVELKVTKIA